MDKVTSKSDDQTYEGILVTEETAIKLKEYGWTKLTMHNMAQWKPPGQWVRQLARPTAEEIVRDLPNPIIKDKNIFFIEIVKQYEDWTIMYSCDHTIMSTDNKSLCEAAAEMWLWCKKEGYIQ